MQDFVDRLVQKTSVVRRKDGERYRQLVLLQDYQGALACTPVLRQQRRRNRVEQGVGLGRMLLAYIYNCFLAPFCEKLENIVLMLVKKREGKKDVQQIWLGLCVSKKNKKRQKRIDRGLRAVRKEKKSQKTLNGNSDK